MVDKNHSSFMVEQVAQYNFTVYRNAHKEPQYSHYVCGCSGSNWYQQAGLGLMNILAGSCGQPGRYFRVGERNEYHTPHTDTPSPTCWKIKFKLRKYDKVFYENVQVPVLKTDFIASSSNLTKDVYSFYCYFQAYRIKLLV